MQIKFFSISVSGESTLVDEFNKFLRTHRIVSVQKEITQRETAPCWRICVEAFLMDRLSLELKPECLNRSENGLTFLGYRIFPRTMKLSRRSKIRFRRKICHYHEKYQRGEWTEDDISSHVEPLLSFVKRADSEGYRRRLLINMGLCP